MTRILLTVLIVLTLAYELVLTALAAGQKKKPLPENVRDIYDAAEYTRWREYSLEKSRLSIIEKVFDSAVLIALYATTVFSDLYRILPGGEYVKSILLMTAYTALLTVLTIPFDYIREMKIEEKYGFNRSTNKTFAADQVKSFIVNTVLNVGLVCLALLMYRTFGAGFFGFLYAVIAVFMIGITMFSTTFMKLYNKFTPLEEGELRNILTKMFADAGYELSDIYVMDASARTTKANAFCSGLGKQKKIVLYDNLVNNYTTGEIAAVFAHELGHYRHRDTLKLTGYSLFMMAVVTALIAAFVLFPGISLDYGFAEPSVVFAVIALMGVVMQPVMSILALPSNYISRKFEYRADREAVDNGYGKDMITALKKLHKDSLSDLNPHPVIVALEHNHPTLSQRITGVEKAGAAK
ncbi:MAG: M48 family metallopeptidase [Clostridia bacterium]|nr:M48 family metallopeptidase [Clostridia bacterium]